MRKLIIFPVGLLIYPGGKDADPEFAEFIKENAGKHWFVAVSNNGKPPWFEKHFAGKVTFQYCNAFSGGSRQKGTIVKGLLDANQQKLNLQKSQVVILGYGELDVPMYANSQSVLIRCDWRADLHPKIEPYGIPCARPRFLPDILRLLNEEHPWFFTHLDPFYDTYVLTNAATRIGSDEELKNLANRLQSCLKRGNPENRVEFMVHMLSSLYATDVFRKAEIWSYYPSSRSTNTEEEIISEFVDIARTTFKRRKKNHPLLIRHTPTAPRHMAPQSGREDPTSQVRTIHLHPDYRGAIAGKTVVVFDDYMTHGVSFSVAAAFLKKAGAAKVLAVAAGKFPRDSFVQTIEIGSDPFAPVKRFTVTETRRQNGTIAPEASEAFKRKFA